MARIESQLELVNGIVTVLMIALTIQFVRYARSGSLRTQFAAIACCMIFGGEAMRSMWAWVFRIAVNRHYSVGWMGASPGFLVATTILVIGSLLAMKAFSPEPCGLRPMFLTAAAAAVIPMAVYLLL